MILGRIDGWFYIGGKFVNYFFFGKVLVFLLRELGGEGRGGRDRERGEWEWLFDFDFSFFFVIFWVG